MWRAIAVLLIATTAARAAAIDVVSLGPNDPTLVKLTGPLESSDKDLFLRKILPLSSAVVAFDSDGGSLVTGIQIGETIRLKNFSTLVPNGKRCASSCALAWLGGTRRFMGPESKIGFHSAYSRETRQITGPGNALFRFFSYGTSASRKSVAAATLVQVRTDPPTRRPDHAVVSSRIRRTDYRIRNLAQPYPVTGFFIADRRDRHGERDHPRLASGL